MARGSKVFRPADLSESNASSYPEPFREEQRKRYTRRLGDHAGLKNYGVNLVRVLPDGQSSARHTHSKQDEFVYVVEGEFVLVTDAGRETVGPGTCIGFPAGTGDGHHFLNLTQKDAIFLVIGDRTAGDEVTYPDIDLELKAGPDGVRGFRRKDGTPYPRAARSVAGRCRLGEATFAGMGGKEEDAPVPDISQPGYHLEPGGRSRQKVLQ